MVGTSYQRPSSVRVPGAAYYDTTLGTFVDSTGSKWVDRSGNPVGNLLRINEALVTLLPSSSYWGFATNVSTLRVRTPTPTGRTTAMQLTSAASGNMTIFVVRAIPVSANTVYSMALRSFMAAATARNFAVGLKWFNGAGTTLSTSTGTSATSGSGVWTPATVLTATSPSTAATALPFITILSAAAASEIFYATEACMAPGTITDYIEP